MGGLQRNKDENHTNLYSNSLEVLLKILDTIEMGICVIDEAGKFVYVNDEYCKINGYQKEELTGKLFLAVIHPNNHEKVLQNHYDFMKYKEIVSEESIIRCKDGKNINVSIIMKKIKDLDNNYYKVVSIKDVTKNKKLELEMKKFMMAVGQTVDWIVITNKNGIIEYANDSVERITGYKVEEVIGKDPSIWKSDKYPSEFYKKMWDTILSGKPYRNIIINRKKNKQLFYLDQSISPLKNENGEISYFVSTGKDITENKRLEDKLNYVSQYDIITGIPNRSAFFRGITQEINNAELEEKALAIIIMDINKFIFINETFGIESGDMVLKIIANRLTETVGRENLVARIGGDEFGVILKGVKNPGDVFIHIDKILKVIEKPINIKEQEIVLAMSMGIAMYPNDGENTKQILSRAEIALSQARRSESIKYMFYGNHMNEDAKNFLLMENKLLKALKNNEFVVFYQPYYDLRTHELEGLEALVRWNDKEKGIISPGVFIPILEETGLIKEVGRQIVWMVCKQLREWLDRGFPIVPIAINLSPVQFRDNNLLKGIMDSIEEFDLDPSLIVFEITESTFMQDIAITYELLKTMKKYGFTISIDDFGTGYSSLSYLKKFPVDHLKIDLSFIRDITKDIDDKAIVNAIISMAHHLNLKTIAEGIEEEEQLRELFHLKCDIGQGYYWSKPVPPEMVESFLSVTTENINLYKENN
ncbi:MAG: EAL domain-containing protein [Epulopiscium sp.]|nr:EAL domain-containing protein [Candidatus Epulonipiscium sp.]